MESEFLGGQHIIKEFAGMSEGINPTAIGAYDRDIKDCCRTINGLMQMERKRKRKQIADLKVAVKKCYS